MHAKIIGPINHHHLYIFWTLTKQGTFTNAAKALRIAQSAVTLQVKSLEEHLGLILIDRRRSKKLLLTEEGQKVADFADGIFNTSEDLRLWASMDSPNRKEIVKVGSLSGLSRNLQMEFLNPIVGRLDLRLKVTTGGLAKLTRMLNEHLLDVILSAQKFQSSTETPFHSHVLNQSPMVIVISAEGWKSLKKKGFANSKSNVFRQLSLLSDRGFYIPGHNFEVRTEMEGYFEEIEFSPVILGEIDDVALLRLLALHSDHFVVLPRIGVEKDILNRSLKCLGSVGGIQQKFYAITRERRRPHPITGDLILQMQSRRNINPETK